jgi:hypothetical protein
MKILPAAGRRLRHERRRRPDPALSLERITADPPLAGRLPRQAEISPGGRWVSFLRLSQADSEVLELWAQPAAGGEPRKLVAAADLLGAPSSSSARPRRWRWSASASASAASPATSGAAATTARCCSRCPATSIWCA